MDASPKRPNAGRCALWALHLRFLDCWWSTRATKQHKCIYICMCVANVYLQMHALPHVCSKLCRYPPLQLQTARVAHSAVETSEALNGTKRPINFRTNPATRCINLHCVWGNWDIAPSESVQTDWLQCQWHNPEGHTVPCAVKQWHLNKCTAAS